MTTIPSLADLVSRTSVHRDRYVDALRVGSLGVVVVAHWVLALVVVDGAPIGRSTVAQLLTWPLMVMPVFFAVGGFGHARALGRPGGGAGYAAFLHGRATRLLGPVAVAVALWALAATVMGAAWPGVERTPAGLALDRALTPLWFVAVYLVVAALAPLTFAAHRRAPRALLAALVAAVAALDALRRAGHDWTAGASLLLVWLTLHQLGYLWSDGTLTRRGVAPALALGGFGAAALLTAGLGRYPLDMQGLPGSTGSNFAPPTLALLTHGVGYVGAVLCLRGPAERLLERPRVWAGVAAAGSVAMTVLCWHLAAVFAVQGVVLAAGVDLPALASPGWWLLLPAWLVACCLPLAVLVAALRRHERPPTAAGVPNARVVVAGVVLSAAGVLAVSQVGLDGLLRGAVEPVLGVSVPAWAGLALVGLGWGLLRGHRDVAPLPAGPAFATGRIPTPR